MTATATVEIGLSVTVAEFDFLYRRLVLQINEPAPIQLMQKLHNTRQVLRHPLIIDLETTEYGAVSEEGDRDDRVSDQPVLSEHDSYWAN